MIAIHDPWQLDALTASPRYAHATRHEIAGYVRHLFDLWYGNTWEDVGACLHWAHAGCCVLRLCGLRSILQAGTMNWPISRDENADITHFSYEWSPTEPASAARISQGALPECHVWIALPDQGEIVDFSTGGFKRLCQERHSITWETEDPPPFLWCDAHSLPRGVYYQPKMEAIKFVLEFLSNTATVA